MASEFIAMVFAVLKGKGIDTKGMSPKEAIRKFNELNCGAGRNRKKEDPVERAKLEKRYDSEQSENLKNLNTERKISLQLFSSPGLEEQSNKELHKSLNSKKKNILEHEKKIKNPEQYVTDWGSRDIRYKNGAISKRKKEIERFKQDIEVIEGYLRDESRK